MSELIVSSAGVLVCLAGLWIIGRTEGWKTVVATAVITASLISFIASAIYALEFRP